MTTKRAKKKATWAHEISGRFKNIWIYRLNDGREFRVKQHRRARDAGSFCPTYWSVQHDGHVLTTFFDLGHAKDFAVQAAERLSP